MMKIRAIRILLILDEKVFPNTGGSNIKEIIGVSLPGYLHIDVNISRQPGLFGTTAQASIYGMKIEDAFSATKYNSFSIQYFNKIQIFAGYLPNDIDPNSQASIYNATKQMPLIYLGSIISAGVNMNDKNRTFAVSSIWAGQAAVNIQQSISINAQTTFKSLIDAIVNNNNLLNTTEQYSVIFSPNASDSIVLNAQYSGSFTQQLKQACDDYGYQYLPKNGVIYISQVGQSFSIDIKTISVNTGMQGYPIVMPNFFQVKSYFGSNIDVLDKIYLDTAYTPLCNAPNGINPQGNSLEYLLWQNQINLQSNGELWENIFTIAPLLNNS